MYWKLKGTISATAGRDRWGCGPCGRPNSVSSGRLRVAASKLSTRSHSAHYYAHTHTHVYKHAITTRPVAHSILIYARPLLSLDSTTTGTRLNHMIESRDEADLVGMIRLMRFRELIQFRLVWFATFVWNSQKTVLENWTRRTRLKIIIVKITKQQPKCRTTQPSWDSEETPRSVF